MTQSSAQGGNELIATAKRISRAERNLLRSDLADLEAHESLSLVDVVDSVEFE